MAFLSNTSPSPSRTKTSIFFAAAYTGASALAQLKFSAWGYAVVSPLELALWLAILAGLIGSVARLSASDRGGLSRRHLLIATMATASILIFESSDWIVDSGQLWNSTNFQTIDYIFNASIAITITISLFVLTRLPKKYVWVVRSIRTLIVFQTLSFLSEVLEAGHVFGNAYATQFSFLIQLAELLCIEFYIFWLAFSQAGVSQKAKAPAFEVNLNGKMSGLFVGSNARQVCEECKLIRRASHPPVAIAFYPGFREIALYLVIFWLALTAGRALKRATGKSLTSQIIEMTRLWFKDGIDPPSYYAQELYEPTRLYDVPHYLTRFETKNGLLGALNKLIPKPFPGNEMSDKALFAECCAKHGIPHPQTLIAVSRDKVEWHCTPAELETNLFCKRQRGMGAMGTLTFRCKSPGHYVDENNREYDLGGMLAMLKQYSTKNPMLVQPWLRNHPAITDLAIDSLITIRVVTCMDERGEAEVTLAMLRLLAKLEPQWRNLPDGEYAAPIELSSGVMGLFTGDNFKTSHIRYENHLVTGAPIKGRVLAEWAAIKTVAVSAHMAFPHRLLIGWDIALTENGPIVLEGNTNLDVMFMQRVHDTPAGRTRFGELVNFHLMSLYQKR